MDSRMVIVFYIFLLIWRGNVYGVDGQSNDLKVTDFGAIADGITDSREAFEDAWKKACETEGGGTVVVPFGTYLLSGADFEGPCKGETLFNMDGSILKASSDPTLEVDYWITFYKIDGLKVIGNGGTFDGQGSSAWERSHTECQHDSSHSSCNSFPTSIKFNYVRNGIVQDIKSVNSKRFHIHIHESDNLTVKNADISAPADSPNTDGIHIGNSNNVEILDTRIATGDDCVSMTDGSTNINITGVWCGPGHGISIGSLGKYKDEKDVSEITVSNCTFTDTDNGLRIKTWAPSASPPTTASNIRFADININNAKNPIIIDQYYCPQSSCNHDGESQVKIKGVSFTNVRGFSASQVAVTVNCSKNSPCHDIEFTGLHLTLGSTGQPTVALCSNANAQFDGAGGNQIPSSCS